MVLYEQMKSTDPNQLLYHEFARPKPWVMRDDASWLKGSTLEIVVFPVDLWDLLPCGLWRHFKSRGIIELRFPTKTDRLQSYKHLCVYVVSHSH